MRPRSRLWSTHGVTDLFGQVNAPPAADSSPTGRTRCQGSVFRPTSRPTRRSSPAPGAEVEAPDRITSPTCELSKVSGIRKDRRPADTGVVRATEAHLSCGERRPT